VGQGSHAKEKSGRGIPAKQNSWHKGWTQMMNNGELVLMSSGKVAASFGFGGWQTVWSAPWRQLLDLSGVKVGSEGVVTVGEHGARG
jgi:hypothetical protein